MSLAVSAPVLVPLATAAATALAAGRPRLQQGVSLAGAGLFMAAALAVMAQVGDVALDSAFGGWPAPFGIAFVIDRTGAILILVTALMGLASLVYLASDCESGPRPPMLLPLVHGMLAGVAGTFATADLFNLYVWFEVMLIAALGVLAIGGRADQLDATFRYLGLNLLGTLLLLAAIGFIYAATGHLNFAALHEAAKGLPPALTAALAATLGLALLLKSGAFPLYAWLPASYHTLPAPVLALVAGLLTKAGVYAILRLGGDVFAPLHPYLLETLGWVAAATMLMGVLGAAYHWDMRRILAFHIISQIGYILLAIALGGEAGHGAAVFYTVHHIVVKANLFLIAGLICSYAGSHDLRRLGGLYAARPLLAILFAIPALSLVGVPPLSGFWAKFLVLKELMAQGRIVWTVLALAVSVLTLYSMMKIWMEAFWKPHPDAGWREPALRRQSAWAAVLALAAVTLFIGVNPEPLIIYAQAAAAALGKP